VNEFQIDLHSGLFVRRQTDLFVPDLMPLVLTRTYRPCSTLLGLLGCAATDMSDSAGHHIRLNRDAVRNLKQLVSPSGHVVNYLFNGHHNIVETTVTLPNGKQQRFTFRGEPTGEDTVEPQHH
jgi:hypothetical protein